MNDVIPAPTLAEDRGMNRRAFLESVAALAIAPAVKLVPLSASADLPLYGMSPAMVATPDLACILRMQRKLMAAALVTPDRSWFKLEASA